MSDNNHDKIIEPVMPDGMTERTVMSENPRLLIVDDDKLFRMTVKAMAKDMGEIIEAENGVGALEYLQQHDVDLILLDLVMPGLTGFDVLDALRKQARTASIPVLLLSASEDDADIARAFEMGAVDYLRKPVRKFELIARLTTQLELRRRQLHLEQMVNERTQELLVANLELQATQEQLLQADKMAAIGQLAAGVAHEINNPVGFVTSNIGTLSQYLDDLLMIIDGYETAECALPDEQKKNLQVLKKKVDLAYLKSDVSELLEETTDGLSRIKNIVQDMKELSHVSGNAWELADIHDGIESTLNIVHNEIKYKASVVKVFCESARVMCIPSQINQVIMNILVNAAHAIESTGVITIKTAQDDDRLNISISDTGCGMTPDVIKKIFDPFFTTKPVGKGTGLGLSMSYSIVKKHHGNIEVESQPGKGTTFVITLPREQPATGTNNAGI